MQYSLSRLQASPSPGSSASIHQISISESAQIYLQSVNIFCAPIGVESSDHFYPLNRHIPIHHLSYRNSISLSSDASELDHFPNTMREIWLDSNFRFKVLWHTSYFVYAARTLYSNASYISQFVLISLLNNFISILSTFNSTKLGGVGLRSYSQLQGWLSLMASTATPD